MKSLKNTDREKNSAYNNLEVLEAIQARFDRNKVVKTNNGLLESLISTDNVSTSVFKSLENKVTFGKKTITTTYEVPVTKFDVYDPKFGIPDTRLSIGRQETEINQTLCLKQTVTEEVMESFMSYNSNQVVTIVEDMVTNLLPAINTKLIESFDACRGNTTSGTTRPLILEELEEELKALDIRRNIIIVGTTQEEGIVTHEDTNMKAENLGTSLADKDLFVYPAGMLQFLDWDLIDNQGSKLMVTVGEDEYFEVKLDVNYDEDTKLYHIDISKCFDLLMLPFDIFSIGHPLQGVNYMYRVRPTA